VKRVKVLIGWLTIRETTFVGEIHSDWTGFMFATHDAGRIIDLGYLTLVTDKLLPYAYNGESRKGWSFLTAEAIDNYTN